MLVFMDSLRVLRFRDPKDGNVELLFKDIVPSLRDFSINNINSHPDVLFCGQLHYELNGFLHICVKH